MPFRHPVTPIAAGGYVCNQSILDSVAGGKFGIRIANGTNFCRYLGPFELDGENVGPGFPVEPAERTEFSRLPGTLRARRENVRAGIAGGAGGATGHVSGISARRPARGWDPEYDCDPGHDFAHRQLCAATRGAPAVDGETFPSARW